MTAFNPEGRRSASADRAGRGIGQAGVTNRSSADPAPDRRVHATGGQARNANDEQVLRILNDVLQGSAAHLGFILGGTPEYLMDTRRDLYSYEALRSRLVENALAGDDLADLSGPVVRLASLGP